MRCRCVLLAILGLGSAAPPAPAQVVVVPVNPYGPVAPVYGYSYTRVSRHGTLSVGGLYGGTTVVVTQPTVVLPPPPTLQPRFVVDDLAMDVLPREVLEAQGVKVPRREAPPEPIRPPLPPPRPVEPVRPPEVPGRMPELPQPPDPAEDGRVEHARLVRLGREAFAAQEYGRAADRFRQAVRLRPAEPTAHFLLAQALFALGKYPLAADAARAGLALRADWPASAYRFREAYGADLGGFVEQLHRLEEARDRFPDDPNVAFLLGYVLWFDEKRGEARTVFRKALMLGADRAAIGRFLEPIGLP